MSEVKKIATRASYGEVLIELGKEHDIWSFWMPTLRQQPRPVSLKKSFRKDSLTVVLPNPI